VADGQKFSGRCRRRWVWLAGLMFALPAGPLCGEAQADRPLVGLGATKEEVIDVHGWPSGQSSAGAREVLTYPQGQVTLENGRVEKIDFSTDKPWPAPRPRPNPPTPAALTTGQPPPDSHPITPADTSGGPAPNPVPLQAVESPPPARQPVAPAPTPPDPLLERWWRSSRQIVLAGLGTGVLIAAFFYTLVWKRRRRPTMAASPAAIAMRISDAAGGLPSANDMAGWPKDRLQDVVAGLAECDGYAVEFRPEGSDADLAITRPGAPASRVLVCCAPGAAGVVAAKPLKELLATLKAEGAGLGWYVAPGGFSDAARAYAVEHRLRLFDAEALTAELRNVPPLELPRVLVRGDR